MQIRNNKGHKDRGEMRQPIICIWRADGAMLSLFLFSLGRCVVFFISLQRPNSIRHNWNICIRPVLAGILLAAGRFVWAVGWRGAKGCNVSAVGTCYWTISHGQMFATSVTSRHKCANLISNHLASNEVLLCFVDVQIPADCSIQVPRKFF